MHLIFLYVDGKCIELTHSFAARLLRFRVENTYLFNDRDSDNNYGGGRVRSFRGYFMQLT